MRSVGTPIVKDLVLVGGGHSHVVVLKKFGMRPMPGVRLTLITRDVQTPYSGMLPGFIAGHYSYEECHIDLVPLAAFAGARLYHAEACGIDLQGKLLLCANRPPLPYDILSLDIGSRPKQSDVTGSAEYATPVKPIDRFAARWWHIVARVVTDTRALRIGVIGGGAGGVELTLAMQHRLRRQLVESGQNPDRLHFVLVTADGLLATHNQSVARIFKRVLEERRVELHLDSEVVAVESGCVRCASGAAIALDEIIWVTQAGAAHWLKESGLACNPDGFVRVRDTLQSVTDPDVFAAGDVAAVENHPRPKAGVFAVRQGEPLFCNLQLALAGQHPKPFIPQTNFLSLISTGDKYAVASRGRWAAEGKWLWTLKDWIDRRFMHKYSDLPVMSAMQTPRPAAGVADAAALREISAIAMRCGGCGAKVGSTILARVMTRLEVLPRDDVIIGLDAPDDAAVVRPRPGKMLIHTVDYLPALIDDPYVFGRIAANHSLGDIYAMGGEPQSALAIATVPYGIESKVEDDLFQIMSGALEVLNDAHCALVGGHTTEGAELAIGFAITGAVGENEALRKSTLAPGEALILTKPLGTGTLFAAAMRRHAKGRWIDAALTMMQVSSRESAACLRRFGASACTDVTGFGVVGHLVEMTKPSGVDVELDLNAVPLLEGARETVEAGIFSSLQPQNLRLRRAVNESEALAGDPRYALLFDPQTAGGLLAGVPADRADRCVAELRKLGYEHAAIIGRVLPASGAASPIRIGARAQRAAAATPRARVPA
ncbi:MAG: selenide, water dikinase SelD [Xanthobacteraceae bacterium]|jgi:selenide, water dikinase